MESQKGSRVIVLVDMDCFYVQVEQKLQPEYRNKPCAVVQYNAYRGGGIIAVNYEARAKGVSRNKRGEDARKVCPDIHLFRVPEVRGKADLTRYREAGASVMEVLCKFSECVERASIDEAYLDVTEVVKTRMRSSNQVTSEQIPNSFVIGWRDKEEDGDSLQNWLQTIYEEDHLYNDKMLATAAVLVEEIRAAVYAETGFRCSAGIAHNKVLAKLTCGLHKPNKQTVLPEASIPILYKDIPVNKVRGLGGKFGDEVIETFKVKTMADLSCLPKQQFINSFGEKSGCWLYYLSRGIENEAVVSRQLPKSIGCGKNFPGKSALNTKEKVSHWVKQLAIELEERLLKDQENNCRVARLLTISVRNQVTPGYSTVSRSCPIHIYSADKIAHDAFAALLKFNTSSGLTTWSPAILSLAIAAGKFEDRLNDATSDIQSYFKSPKKKVSENSTHNASDIDTVLDLLDSEPELLNSPNGDAEKGKNTSETSASTTRASSDISCFFNAQLPSTSKTCGLEEIFAKQDTSANQSSHCHRKETDNMALTNATCSNLKRDLNDASVEKPKAKGFFARKLEEKLKLAANDSLPQSNLTKAFESVSSPLENTNDSDCNKASVGNDKPKPKGFFATKREEKCMARAEEESTNITETEAQPVDSTNMPSTSASSSDLLVQQQKDMYSNLDPELTYVCNKCNRRIPVWEEEEHSDFHMALDLSRELKKEMSVKKVAATQTTKPLKTAKKRGRSSKAVSLCKKPNQQNTIDSFFK